MQQLQVNKTNDSQAANLFAYLYLVYELSSILSGKRALINNFHLII